METRRPHVRTIPMSCAPSQAPCPICGKRGRRKQVLRRRVRTIVYQQVVFLDVTYGELPRPLRPCPLPFRTTRPASTQGGSLYDDKVRQAVLDRIPRRAA